jgi:hypothetical protein
MPLLFQKRVSRDDLRANPDVLYVFGDNTHRVGMGGQAGEMRGEPNAIGVCTKLRPTNEGNAFFSDKDFDAYKKLFDDDVGPIFLHLLKGGIVVWPLDGIGTGLADLPRRAPKCYEHVLKTLAVFQGKNPHE